MADAIRLTSIKRGHDPRNFDLMAFGGAGPVHGGALAVEMGMQRCIAPRSPGVLSALGLLVSDVEYDNAQTYVRQLNSADVGDVERVLATLQVRGLRQMATDGHLEDECVAQYSADMRYVGQSSELEVPLSLPLGADSLQDARARFVAEHDRVYGYGEDSADVEIVNLRALVLRVPDAEIAVSLKANFGVSAESIPLKEVRECWFDESGPVETPVFDRTATDGQIDVAGPAIIQQEDTTVVVYPSFHCRTGPLRNLVMERSQ
jgi:N-methylhydantoinase A